MSEGLDLPGPDAPNVTQEHRNTIAKFRRTVQDVLRPTDDDYYLYRWLKARNFDEVKAERMLRNSKEWRKAYGTDKLLTEWEPPEVLVKYWPGGVYGFDKDGHPILWQLSKNFDAQAMLRCVKKSDIIKYHIYRTEKLMNICEQQTKKLGRRIGKTVNVSDLEGFTLKMAFSPGVVGMMKHIFSIIEANYPERLHSSIVINAPSIFSMFFNILKPLLNEETRKKVHVLGHNWQDTVCKMIDRNQLPVYWGGTARDPDDFCSNHITVCRPIPDTFFQMEKYPLDREKMTRATVLRGLAYSVELYVRIPQSVIRWAFETDDYDIGFGIFRRDDTGEKNAGPTDTKDMEVIQRSTRLNCNVVPETGVIRCLKPGIYVLKFDNSYSWVNSKTVYYEAEVIEPGNESILQDPSSSLTDNSFDVESTHL